MDEQKKYVFLKKSTSGSALYLQEEGTDNKAWYNLTDKVKKFAERLEPDSKITIESKIVDGKNLISFFKFVGADSVKSNGFAKRGFKKFESKSTTVGTWGQRDPNTQDSIVKQTVMKAASELVSSMDWTSLDEALSAFDVAFNHMYEKVNSKPNSELELVTADINDPDSQ